MSSCVTDDLAKGHASGIPHDTDGIPEACPFGKVISYARRHWGPQMAESNKLGEGGQNEVKPHTLKFTNESIMY